MAAAAAGQVDERDGRSAGKAGDEVPPAPRLSWSLSAAREQLSDDTDWGDNEMWWTARRERRQRR